MKSKIAVARLVGAVTREVSTRNFVASQLVFWSRPAPTLASLFGSVFLKRWPRENKAPGEMGSVVEREFTTPMSGSTRCEIAPRHD